MYNENIDFFICKKPAEIAGIPAGLSPRVNKTVSGPSTAYLYSAISFSKAGMERSILSLDTQ